MGYFKVNDNVIDEFASSLSPYSTLLLLFFIRASDVDGSSFYGEKKMAEILNVSKRTIIRSVEELKSKGFIKVALRREKNKTSIYTLCPTVTRYVPNRHEASDSQAYKGRHREGKQSKEVNAYGFIPDS